MCPLFPRLARVILCVAIFRFDFAVAFGPAPRPLPPRARPPDPDSTSPGGNGPAPSMASSADPAGGKARAPERGDEGSDVGLAQRRDERRRRKRAKAAKKANLVLRRYARIAKNGGPPGTAFVGKHKWLGGAVDPATGTIYGIPSHAHQIICITPSTPKAPAKISTIPLPNEHHQGHFKWLRGVVHDGCLYGIPAWSTKGVLKVHLKTKEVSVLPLPKDSTHYESQPIPGEVDRGRWMWHGGAIAKSSKGEAAIYCPPSNAEYVLKVCLDGSDRVEEIGPPLTEGQNKWYGEFFRCNRLPEPMVCVVLLKDWLDHGPSSSIARFSSNRRDPRRGRLRLRAPLHGDGGAARRPRGRLGPSHRPLSRGCPRRLEVARRAAGPVHGDHLRVPRALQRGAMHRHQRPTGGDGGRRRGRRVVAGEHHSDPSARGGYGLSGFALQMA